MQHSIGTVVNGAWRRVVFALSGTALAVSSLGGTAGAQSVPPLVAADYAEYSAKPLLPPRPHPLNTRIPAQATTSGFTVKFTPTGKPLNGQQTEVAGQIYVPSFTYYVPGSAPGANGVLYARLETRTFPGGFATVSSKSIIANGASQVRFTTNPGGIPGGQFEFLLVFNKASSPKSVLVSIVQKQTRYDYQNISMMKPHELEPTGTKDVPLGGAFLYRL